MIVDLLLQTVDSLIEYAQVAHHGETICWRFNHIEILFCVRLSNASKSGSLNQTCSRPLFVLLLSGGEQELEHELIMVNLFSELLIYWLPI